MARPAKYSDEFRARAVELYAELGLAEAVRRLSAEGHPVSKTSVRAWAAAAGVLTDANQNTREATVVAAEARRLRASQALEALVPILADVAVAAAETELAIHRAMARLRDTAHPVDDDEAAELAELLGVELRGKIERAKTRVAMAAFGPRLSEIVGSRTRAVHDLVILRGGEPENAAGVKPVELLEQARERRLHLAGGTATG